MSAISLSGNMSNNLSSLQATQKLMEATEYKLTSGKKVDSALDDPIAYFTSEEHLQRANDLQTIKDNMSESIQTMNAADEGITGILDLISSAKSLAQSAYSADDSSEIDDLVSQYNEILSQIDDMADDSGYGGTNLLVKGTTMTVSFDEDDESKIAIKGFECTYSALSMTTATASGWYSGTGSSFTVTSSAIDTIIDKLDAAKSSLRSESKKLSSQLSVVTSRQDFTTNLITTLQSGSANLVNADTTAEGVNLTALQTQQSLAINSLTIANSASQAVLSLFQ
jgi:flagellin